MNLRAFLPKNKLSQDIEASIQSKKKPWMEPTNESRTESFIMQIISKEKSGVDSKRANRLSNGLPISDRSRSYNQQASHTNHDDSWNFNHSKFQDEFAMDDKSSRRI